MVGRACELVLSPGMPGSNATREGAASFGHRLIRNPVLAGAETYPVDSSVAVALRMNLPGLYDRPLSLPVKPTRWSPAVSFRVNE